MKEICLWSEDSNYEPCGWSFIVNEIGESRLIATIPVDWLMLVIE